jgi:hypothetical protein
LIVVQIAKYGDIDIAFSYQHSVHPITFAYRNWFGYPVLLRNGTSIQLQAMTGIGSIVFNWLSCIHEYHKLREGNKR